MGKPVYSIGRLVKTGVLHIYRGSHAGSADNGGFGGLQIELAQITIQTDTIHLATIVSKEGYIALVKHTSIGLDTAGQIKRTQPKETGIGGIASVGLTILGVVNQRGRNVCAGAERLDDLPCVGIILFQRGKEYFGSPNISRQHVVVTIDVHTSRGRHAGNACKRG